MSSSTQPLLILPRSFQLNQYICSSCIRCPQRQWKVRRTVSTAAQILKDEDPKPKDFTPKPLLRPIGVLYPPKPGENSGIDPRPWRQRRDDLFDYNKHLVRRKELYVNPESTLPLPLSSVTNVSQPVARRLAYTYESHGRTEQAAKPYFRDWSRTQYHKGKTFISPARIFRADRSLYFPNMVGSTLASPSTASDTTSVLQDRISIVSVYSGRWAETQTRSFTDDNNNLGLGALMSQLANDGNRGGAPLLQKVEINVEPDWMKAFIVRLFMGGIRKQRRKEDWERYFLVKKGVTDEMREAMGMANSKVGYVYLVDWLCRIRWAGSADAEGAEKEGLVAGVQRLVEGWRRERDEGNKRQGQKSIAAAGGSM
ncbi:MAG: hypothetical protein Q9180_005229 [Flavoplaca navasiana]